MSDRRLTITLRRVPAESRAAYDSAWAQVRVAGSEGGANAWRFRSSSIADVFVEFLEFAAGADPRASPAVAGALRRLQQAFPSTSHDLERHEEWQEA